MILNVVKLKSKNLVSVKFLFLNGSQNPTEDEYGIYQYRAEYDSNCLSFENRKAEYCRKLEVNLNKN